MKKFEH